MLAFLRRQWAALLWPAFAVAATAFYSIPLFAYRATIHWDLADITYPAQAFFAAAVHSGGLPHWTPYLESGIPFLADPRSGAWYPLHWPFFLLGIAPRTLVWELALHSFVAMGGAYLLARRLFGSPGPAILAGLFYAWGGYFAAHASLLGAFEAAAWLPWLLWGALRAVEDRGVRWIAFSALTLGLIVLAGDPATALECFVTLACFLAATQNWKRGAITFVSSAVLAPMLAAIQIVPGVALRAQSHPAGSGLHFTFRELATIVSADYYNLIGGLYTGPGDPRQYYLYSGLLLIPLAIAGIVRRERWQLLLAVLAPTLFFEAALRPPGDAWFPAQLSLALAACSGAIWVEVRWVESMVKRQYVWIALAILSTADLYFWNLYKNPLVFARATFADVYGKPQPSHSGPSLTRQWAPYAPVGFPQDNALITRTEVTYGAGLAELDRYQAYLTEAMQNQRLLDGLAATTFLLGRNQSVPNPNALARITAPAQVDFVADRAAASAALAKLDPATATLVEAPARNVMPSVRSLAITGYSGDSYRIRYSAAAESFLRIAVPYYPGWTVTIDGAPATVYPADEALLGAFVPAGQHEGVIRFEPQHFLLGVLLTIAAGVLLGIGLILT